MTQKAVVLKMLRERGPEGVSAHELIYKRGITRAAAIIHELRHEDKFNIVTIDEGKTIDGREKLARYVLKDGAPSPRPPARYEELPPLPAMDLKFPCGCVRAADGRSWRIRCPEHEGKVVVLETVRW